jgi:hypothetical protein
MGINRTWLRGVWAALLVTSIVLLSACDTRFKINLVKSSKPTFNLSGNAALLSFRVSGKSGPPIWEIYGPSGHPSVRTISPIKYGEIPAGCVQGTLASGSPPPLVEGETYLAVGLVTNSPPNSIRFTIRNGEVVELSNSGNQ